MADLFVNTPYENVERPIEPVQIHTQSSSPSLKQEHYVERQPDQLMPQPDRSRSYAAEMGAYQNLGISDRDITIDESLIFEENDRAIKTRIPKTWGEDIRFLWIPKSELQFIHQDHTILTKLDPNKDYPIYDNNDSVVQHMKGSDLRRNHYDAIDKSVRKRAENRTRSTINKKTSRNTHSRSRK